MNWMERRFAWNRKEREALGVESGTTAGKRRSTSTNWRVGQLVPREGGNRPRKEEELLYSPGGGVGVAPRGNGCLDAFLWGE